MLQTLKKFNWQEGYGAFSHSCAHIDNLVRYIHNQQEHHKKTLFLDEYKLLMKKFEIEYDERYIFHNLLEG